MLNFVTTFAAACKQQGSFFDFPTWYRYLPSVQVGSNCVPKVGSLTDIWLILAAVIEILLRIAVLVAVGFIVYGGYTFVLSQGDPAKTAEARNTIINALSGMVIAILAATIIGFLAGSVHN